MATLVKVAEQQMLDDRFCLAGLWPGIKTSIRPADLIKAPSKPLGRKWWKAVDLTQPLLKAHHRSLFMNACSRVLWGC